MANPNERILNLQREPLIVGAGGAVNSVNGKTGDVVLTAEDVGALPDSTTIPSKTSDLENDSDFQTGDEVNQAIGIETTARENADNGLQGQIDGLAAASDVTDIVGTYADLQAYDTSKLKDNDIIKVLQDENQNDETTYYRWSTSTEAFTLIGEEGPYYTKAAADQKFQDKLTAGSNITIDANNEISADIPVFTGTDGVDAGTAGLVPAPATTDAGKYLKADGTWDSIVIPQSGIPTNATFWGASYDSVNNKVDGEFTVNSTYAGSPTKLDIGKYTNGSIPYIRSEGSAIALGGSKVSLTSGGTKRLSIDGSNIFAWATLYMAQSSSSTSYNQIKSVADPTSAQDAATKNYTDNLVINYSAINGASAPTTATEAKYVGQLYYDTTNDDMYYCSAITAQGTDPETYTYTWSQFGGGGPTVVQTTGTSATDVMSQAATTNMIYPSGSETSNTNIFIKGGGQGSPNYVCIGPAQVSGNVDTSNGATAIGGGAMATGTRGVAIAAGSEVAQASGQDSIAIRGQAKATNSIAIGRNANVASSSTGSIAIGYNAGSATSAPYAVALGRNAYTNSSSIAIGDGSSTSGNDGGIAIGRSSRAFGPDTMAIGENITTTGLTGSVVIGNGPSLNTAYATRNNEFCVHASTTANQPMVHSNVDTPTLGTDAANKNYVDSIYPVGAVFTSTSATAPTIAGGTWTEIGTQTIGSSTVHYYERTA